VRLNYLVWRFQFGAFVENKTTFFTDYLLRQDLTAVAERNTTETNYLCIMTKRSLNYIINFFIYLKSHSIVIVALTWFNMVIHEGRSEELVTALDVER
jgi:hypothetical protein